LAHQQPQIFNSDQGSQFTAPHFLEPLQDRSIAISMDGRGRALDNVFIERLWRSVKYELIYPGDFGSGAALWPALENYFHYYNYQRPHQALHYATPATLYHGQPTRWELHQSNLGKKKPSTVRQRALPLPIASEPVRRFGLGRTPGATPARHCSLPDNLGLWQSVNRQSADPRQIRGPFLVQTMGSTSG